MSVCFRHHQLEAWTYFSINRNTSVFAIIRVGINSPLYAFLTIISKNVGLIIVVWGIIITLLGAEVGVECDDNDGGDDDYGGDDGDGDSW